MSARPTFTGADRAGALLENLSVAVEAVVSAVDEVADQISSMVLPSSLTDRQEPHHLRIVRREKNLTHAEDERRKRVVPDGAVKKVLQTDLLEMKLFQVVEKTVIITSLIIRMTSFQKISVTPATSMEFLTYLWFKL